MIFGKATDQVRGLLFDVELRRQFLGGNKLRVAIAGIIFEEEIEAEHPSRDDVMRAAARIYSKVSRALGGSQ